MAFYRYRLFDTDGGDLGELHLAVLVDAGDTIPLGPGRRLRVVDVVAVMETDSPYVGLLTVAEDGA